MPANTSDHEHHELAAAGGESESSLTEQRETKTTTTKVEKEEDLVKEKEGVELVTADDEEEEEEEGGKEDAINRIGQNHCCHKIHKQLFTPFSDHWRRCKDPSSYFLFSSYRPSASSAYLHRLPIVMSWRVVAMMSLTVRIILIHLLWRADNIIM